MACGCKNKGANAAPNVVKNVVKTAPTQEAKPQKTSNGARIIKREIR